MESVGSYFRRSSEGILLLSCWEGAASSFLLWRYPWHSEGWGRRYSVCVCLHVSTRPRTWRNSGPCPCSSDADPSPSNPTEKHRQKKAEGEEISPLSRVQGLILTFRKRNTQQVEIQRILHYNKPAFFLSFTMTWTIAYARVGYGSFGSDFLVHSWLR